MNEAMSRSPSCNRLEKKCGFKSKDSSDEAERKMHRWGYSQSLTGGHSEELCRRYRFRETSVEKRGQPFEIIFSTYTYSAHAIFNGTKSGNSRSMDVADVTRNRFHKDHVAVLKEPVSGVSLLDQISIEQLFSGLSGCKIRDTWIL